MRILVAGVGKSGTTALVYKIAAGLPGCELQPNGTPKHRPAGKSYVVKSTCNPRKGRTFEFFHNFAISGYFDRLVWIVRDPRDQLVSDTLFRWRGDVDQSSPQFRAYMEIIHAKERDPLSVPFKELLRHSGRDDEPWPRTWADFVSAMRPFLEDYAANADIIRQHWFVFRFEDMVDGRYSALENYLGFPVQKDAEIAPGKHDKVVRKKAAGDWRHWFTPEDVPLMQDLYNPVLAAYGYDTADWRLADQPHIAPEHASGYIRTLLEKTKTK